MTKRAILVALCIVMAVLATMTMAAPGATIGFVDDYLLLQTSSLVDISLTGLIPAYASSVFSFSSAVNPTGTPPTDPTLWKFRDFVSQPTLTLEGYQHNTCFDITTGQILGVVMYKSSTQLTVQFKYPGLSGSVGDDTQAYHRIARGLASITMRCYFPIDGEQKPDHFNLLVSNASQQFSVNADLAYPQNGIVHPKLTLTSASISRPVIDRQVTSSELKIEFNTDTPGVYSLTLSNRLSADAANLNTGKFADFFCSIGSNTKAFRIIYGDRLIPGDHVLIMVTKDFLVNGSPIQCAILFNNLSQPLVESDSVSVDLRFADVGQSYELSDYTPTTPGVRVRIDIGHNSPPPTINISASLLVKLGSTIEFKFSSQVDISFIKLRENGRSPRSNYNCGNSNVFATSQVDVSTNSIILKDTTDSVSAHLNCAFEFTTDAFPSKDQTDVATVIVIINGVSHTSLISPGLAIPLYLPAVGTINNIDHTETETGTTITVIDTFTLVDDYETHNQIMKGPMVALKLVGDLDCNFENYKDAVSCEITSPDSPVYQKLAFKFDETTLTWTTKLKDLVSVEKYNILLKCTRNVRKIIKYSLDITPISSIYVTFIDIIDGKHHYGFSQDFRHMAQRSQPTEMTSPIYPTAKALGRFYHTGTVVLPDSWDKSTIKKAIADFNTSVVDSMIREQKGVWTNLKIFSSAASLSPQDQKDRYYMNYRSRVDGFNFSTRYSKDTAISYHLNYANIAPFSSIIPYSRDLLDLYNDQPMIMTITTYFTADMTDATSTSTPQISSVDWKESFYDRKYGSEVTPYDTSNTIVSYYGSPTDVLVNIPIDGCGYEKGYIFNTIQRPGFDFSNSGDAFTDSADKWTNWSQNFNNWGSVQCQEDELCTINADCESGLCKASKCTVLKQVVPPFVDISQARDVPLAFDFENDDEDEDPSTATMTSIVFAAVIAVACTVLS